LIRNGIELSSITTLRILNLPLFDDICVEEEDDISDLVSVFVTAQLKDLAKKVLEEIPFVDVLSFGRKEGTAPYIWKRTSVEQRTYIRGELTIFGVRYDLS
jgi:hypothetical protein